MPALDDQVSRLGFLTKFWFGFGQLAEGIKNTAFGAFLLLFYSQVLGLPAYLAGLAIAVALGLDAIADPLTGSISDALRHRWSRRHPFMYAAAVPAGITFALTFSPPPGIENTALFLWMCGFGLLARLAMTVYQVPHLALGAELTSDYHERTVVVAYRNVLGLVGAGALILVSRQFFLVPTATYPNGELNPAAYPLMGAFFGIVITLSILASALGTHARIPYLPQAPQRTDPFTVRRLAGELRDALRNPSFRALFLGLSLFFVARGTEGTLAIYMGTFFWRLDTGNVLLIPVMGIVGLALGTPVWAVVARKLDKRIVFLAGISWFSLVTFAIPMPKILGFYPPPDSPFYLGILYAAVFLGAAGAAGALVAGGSMLADIADEHEVDVGRRQEGLFFGAISLAGKAAVGLGSGIAGFALFLIDFPRQVAPASVPDATTVKLALLAGPGVAAVMIVGVLLTSRYQLTRRRVGEIQDQLRVRRAAGG